MPRAQRKRKMSGETDSSPKTKAEKKPIKRQRKRNISDSDEDEEKQPDDSRSPVKYENSDVENETKKKPKPKTQRKKKTKEALTDDSNPPKKTKSRGSKKKSVEETIEANEQLLEMAKENEKEPPGEKYIGGHNSINGGLYKAALESASIKGRAFGLFLKSNRQWAAKALSDDDVDNFQRACKKLNYSLDKILPHGTYLMNCASTDSEQLKKSRDCMLEEVKRCQRLGIKLYNFHPGSTCGKGKVEEGLQTIADSINMVLKETKDVIILLENMSCQGNTIGGKFSELSSIIDKVDDKSRIGVCLDTCHAFAAGFDIRTEESYEAMMSEFDETIGLKYLKAIHLNDSKGKLGCHADRHENIGKGEIGLDGFKLVMNDSRLNNMPMILETPFIENVSNYEEEIETLYGLVK
ncbi:DgyrCDS6188 [Dimorphilus gyrociliatus]|uniref:DgyrCDS6188 n=1 Tax=Dimorphilus gyrociliatus TaxID=2664684 RepID=A0A7I8VQ62_9ANNE|nr:DgyrCDS6188 [Dimorphilus gyrociliatus]